MLSNDQIQAGLVAYLKSKTLIIAEVTASEIRENEWQGTSFKYPNIRVRMISNTPPTHDSCNLTKISVSFLVFTEDASSKNADKIAGIINDTLHNKSFSSTSIEFSLWTTNLIPAIRSDERTWRSEVLMNGIAG